MENSASATLNARITAIEDDSLVLKLSDTGETIRWPIASIPQPFDVSDHMSLELHAHTATTRDLAATKSSATREVTPQARTEKTSAKTASSGQLTDEEKRKLLESLIN